MKVFVRLVLASSLLAAQPRVSSGQILDEAAGGTFLVFGRVVEAGSTSGVPNATVELRGISYSADAQLADPQGRFVFRDVPTGDYQIRATAPGYVRVERSDGSAPKALFQVRTRSTVPIEVSLHRAASIRGRIIGEDGDPLPGISVRVVPVNGRATYSATSRTDDLGEYSVVGLPPGTYAVVTSPRLESHVTSGDDGVGRLELIDLVTGAGSSTEPRLAPPPLSGLNADASTAASASPRTPGVGTIPDNPGSSSRFMRPTVFFGGADTGTQLLQLGTGDERSGVDIIVPVVRAVTVDGIVVGAPSGLNVTIRLLPLSENARLPAAELARTQATVNGRFRLSAVPDGRYRVVATSWVRSESAATVGYFSEELLDTTVDDLANFSLALRPGPHAVGSVHVTNDAVGRVQPDEVVFEAVEWSPVSTGGQISAPVATDGEFRTGPLLPTWYRIQARLPSGVILGWSTTQGGSPSTCPFKLTDGVQLSVVVRAGASVSGVVVGNAAEPLSVTLIPADHDRAEMPCGPSFKEASVGEARRFSLDGLEPGDYYVVALPREDMSVLLSAPNAIDNLPSEAKRVSLRPGESRGVEVKVGHLR